MSTNRSLVVTLQYFRNADTSAIRAANNQQRMCGANPLQVWNFYKLVIEIAEVLVTGRAPDGIPEDNQCFSDGWT